METDEYVTMTELQLEQEFGTSPEALEFIAELIKGTLPIYGLPTSSPAC